jgi:hypothetical protein
MKAIPGDYVIVPQETLRELNWLRVAYRLAYAFCFGAGCGLTFFLLNRMFTTAAMLAFSL